MDAVDMLRNFIVSEMEWKGKPEQLTRDYALIDNGVVDSLGLFMLVSFIEDHFGIVIGYDELNPQNFDTIGSIARLIERKHAAGNGSA